jgi:LAO/AO transport system kinase
MMSLADAVLDGNRLALARLLTHIENDTLEGREALEVLFAHTGQAHLVGVTGAPGTGKSSLVNQLARSYRNPAEKERLAGDNLPDVEQQPKRVGVIAVDPSSPFTGGAILGDRVRMRDLAGDPGVFIRSMASRGSLGGLASTTSAMVQALDAAGYEIILIETVGAGQAEVDIARLAHTTLVVEAPGLGDEIQAIKAGILEIADILVVNKADRPGVENTERALRNMLQLSKPTRRDFAHHGRMLPAAQPEMPESDPSLWQTPVLRTVSTEGMGIEEVKSEIARHQKYLKESGDWKSRDRERLETELNDMLQDVLLSRWRETITPERYGYVVARLVQRQITPWQALELLINGGRV